MVTTSGPGTGHAPEVSKLQAMKSAIGDFPVAVASGVSSSNVESFLPYAHCYLIATGIRGGDGLIDLNRLSTVQHEGSRKPGVLAAPMPGMQGSLSIAAKMAGPKGAILTLYELVRDQVVDPLDQYL